MCCYRALKIAGASDTWYFIFQKAVCFFREVIQGTQPEAALKNLSGIYTPCRIQCSHDPLFYVHSYYAIAF